MWATPETAVQTESRKTFHHGYLLNEQELRRIVDTATQQIRKANPNGGINTFFVLKFKNGTLTRSNSVEDVLSLENLGPKQIVRLVITITDQTFQNRDL